MKVDALSELFVAWDDTLTEAEDKITRLEREKAERLRLGLEDDSQPVTADVHPSD